MLHFLFPSEPARPRTIDEMFAEQRDELAGRGFSWSLVREGALRAAASLSGIPRGATVVYRGWMLNGGEYERLSDGVEANGARLLTNPERYLLCHHLPRWYPALAEFTPETRVLDMKTAAKEQLRELGWGRYFVKDYVKSLKTGRGSIVESPEEIDGVMADMVRFRGEIEGGVCVRRVEEFRAETERRFFVLGGAGCSPDGGAVPRVVGVAAERISSPFFSVDVVERTDGVERIVEVGDGQVSDLVGWSAARFGDVVERWARAIW